MNNAGMIKSKMTEHITLTQADDESIDNSFGAGATAVTKRHATVSPPLGGWQGGRRDAASRLSPRHLFVTADNGSGMSGERLRQSLQYFSRLDASAGGKANGRHSQGTSMFGAGMWVLICGFLSDADPLDEMRMIATEQGSEEIWMCDLNLVRFCGGDG